MEHYAFLNSKKIVTEVITGHDDGTIIEGISDWAEYYGNFRGQLCLMTSDSGKIRKNYAGIGYKYDSTLDAFIPPKPYKSWQLNKETCQWSAPVPHPDDEALYSWNETAGNWEVVE